MSKKVSKLIAGILILVFISLGLWLVNKNFPASGQIEVTAVLGQDRPAISSLGPPLRLKFENDYQLILDTPVYFDLRTPSWFRQAKVMITYQAGPRQLTGLGGKTGPDWQYELKKPTTIVDLDQGWQQATFDFDLNTLYRSKNVARFLIETNGQIGEPLKVSEIKIILSR